MTSHREVQGDSLLRGKNIRCEVPILPLGSKTAFHTSAAGHSVEPLRSSLEVPINDRSHMQTLAHAAPHQKAAMQHGRYEPNTECLRAVSCFIRKPACESFCRSMSAIRSATALTEPTSDLSETSLGRCHNSACFAAAAVYSPRSA